MNLSKLLHSIAPIAALALTIDVAHATNPANTWRDCITLNAAGKYTPTPGIWTQNGVVIGTTWNGNFSLSGPTTPGIPHCDSIRFPPGVVPNDFHYGPDKWEPAGGGPPTFYWGDFYWGSYFAPLVIPLIVPADGTGANIAIVLDWNVSPNDPFMHLSTSTGASYSGPLSGFNPSAFNLAIIGADALSLDEYPAFCSGDGTGTSCPCGNNSAPGSGEGCTNTTGMGGLLQASGVASVSADSFVLSGSQMPNSFVLYFQGTAMVNAGNGTVFGDGKRCAGGSVIRLDIELNSGGASQYPGAGDPLVSIKGAIPPTGGTRTYQAWYRDAVPFCTPQTFNLTNGVLATWAP